MRVVFGVLLCIATLAPASGFGQAPSEAEDRGPEEGLDDLTPDEVARQHHVRGVEAQQAGDLPRAVTSFRASLDIQFRDSTANNLAVALESLGRFVEAIALYDQLLALPADEVRRPRAQLEAERAHAAAQVSTLTLSVQGVPEAVIAVDGVPLGTFFEGRALAHRLDPGAHIVVASAGGNTRSTELTLNAGDTRVLEIAFGVPSPPELAQTVALESDDAPSVDIDPPVRSRRVVYWVLGALVVVGAAVALGVALRPDADTFPEETIPTWGALTLRP